MSLSLFTARAAAPAGEGPYTVAHRGCWLRENSGEFYIPENSPAGIAMAKRFGYPAIECDVKYTLDGVMVVMHDRTINRTMRNAADYSKIEEPVRVSETTFSELREKYVLESSDPSLRTPIPTLEEMLLSCKEHGIVAMLHSSVVESYSLAQRILGDDGFIAFSGDEEAVSQARKVSQSLILLDPRTDTAESTVSRLQRIGGRCGMSTMKYNMLDYTYISTVKNAGFDVQASIFAAPHEQKAAHDGVTIQLSDFWWFQTGGRRPYWKSTERVSLQPGQNRSLSHPSECGDFNALTLRLSFCGDITVTLSDWRRTKEGWVKKPCTYKLHRDTPGEEIIGLRLYKTTPDITLSCSEKAADVTVRAALYKL